MWLTRSNLHSRYNDTSIIQLAGNGGFIIKKRQEPKSKFLYGPIFSPIRRRKFKTLFKTII